MGGALGISNTVVIVEICYHPLYVVRGAVHGNRLDDVVADVDVLERSVGDGLGHFTASKIASQVLATVDAVMGKPIIVNNIHDVLGVNRIHDFQSRLISKDCFCYCCHNFLLSFMCYKLCKQGHLQPTSPCLSWLPQLFLQYQL